MLVAVIAHKYTLLVSRWSCGHFLKLTDSILFQWHDESSPLNAVYRVIPTKWRSYRDHRLCGVTSPYIFASWSLIPIPIGNPVPMWSSLFLTAGPRKINNVWSMSAFIVMAMDAFVIQSMQTCDCASINRSHSSSKCRIIVAIYTPTCAVDPVSPVRMATVHWQSFSSR